MNDEHVIRLLIKEKTTAVALLIKKQGMVPTWYSFDQARNDAHLLFF
jgi:hypothetical protein